jgi:hypothetical protein
MGFTLFSLREKKESLKREIEREKERKKERKSQTSAISIIQKMNEKMH